MNVVFLVAGVSATFASGRVTPVEKVTELLIKIKEKTIEEGKREKELFGKFNDFCHEQEDDKFWRAAKGADKVNRLDAEIEALSTQIKVKNAKIADLEGQIKENEGEIKTKTGEMNDRSKQDAIALKDFDTVLSQIRRAIKHLTGSDVSGTALTEIIALMETSLHLSNPPKALQHLATHLLEEPGKPHAYKFHSQTVVVLLEKLATEFKNQRLQKDQDALASRSQSEHSIQTLANLVAALGHQKDEFAEEVAAHELKKQENIADRDLGAKHLFEDTDFAHHLVGCAQFLDNANKEGKKNLAKYLPEHEAEHDCASLEIGECGLKRRNYEQRKSTRADELVAISKAIELMQGEGGSSYKSNKRLTAALQMKNQRGSKVSRPSSEQSKEPKEKKEEKKKEEVPKKMSLLSQEQVMDHDPEDEDEDDDDDDASSATSFLQKMSSSLKRHDQKRGVHSNDKKVLQFLSHESKRLQSTMLSVLLLKLTMRSGTKKTDHFQDIRAMINDLIEKLTTQLASEQEQKAWCDTELTQGHKNRDEAQAAIETAASTIDSETAKRDMLVTDINELRAQIATDMAAKEEATKLRNAEKADNERTIADAREGLAAVQEGIKILKEFYEANSTLLQTDDEIKQEPEKENSVEWRAQGEAADGNTIADIRPESDVFSNEYRGNQKESTGIIGILEVIESDYDRTVTSVEENEKTSAEEWKTSDEELAKNIQEAEDGVSTKTDEKEAAEEEITLQEGELKSKKKELKGCEKTLEELKPFCSAPEAGEQLEERRKRREQEVASLREALSILREYS